MTTIAYRNGIIAADTGMSIGDTRVGTTRKIARGPRGLLGGAGGTAGFGAAFLKWVESGDAEERAPDALQSEDGIDRAMVINPDSPTVIRVLEPSGWFDVETEYFVIGTGREIALGVLWQGGTAIEAVRAAIALDAFTWGNIQALSFSGNKPAV